MLYGRSVLHAGDVAAARSFCRHFVGVRKLITVDYFVGRKRCGFRGARACGGGAFLAAVMGPWVLYTLLWSWSWSWCLFFRNMFVERFPRKEKKNFQRFFFIILGENLACTFFFFTRMISKIFFIILGEKKAHASQPPGVRFFSRLHNLKKHFDHTGTRVPTLNNMICASSIF